MQPQAAYRDSGAFGTFSCRYLRLSAHRAVGQWSASCSGENQKQDVVVSLPSALCKHSPGTITHPSTSSMCKHDVRLSYSAASSSVRSPAMHVPRNAVRQTNSFRQQYSERFERGYSSAPANRMCLEPDLAGQYTSAAFLSSVNGADMRRCSAAAQTGDVGSCRSGRTS